MSHHEDSHGHDHGHGHDHEPNNVFFDEGGVAGVGWIYMLLALGIISWLVIWG